MSFWSCCKIPSNRAEFSSISVKKVKLHHMDSKDSNYFRPFRFSVFATGPLKPRWRKNLGKTWRNISCCLHCWEISNRPFTHWFKFNNFIFKTLSTPWPQSSFKGHKNVREHRPHQHHKKRRKDHTESMIYSTIVTLRPLDRSLRRRKKVPHN